MTNELTIRPLTYQDNQEIQNLDDMSGNDVAQWFQEEDDYCEDYAYGLFLNNRLIGYCTIGGADDCPLMIAKHELYNYNALLLSDVYVLPEYRNKSFGLQLIIKAIQLKREQENEPVFLTLLYDSLSNFYEKAGFIWCEDSKSYAMIKPT